MQIIKRRNREVTITYALAYRNANGPGGWSFKCDEKGTPLPHTGEGEAARETLRKIQAGECPELIFEGIEKYENIYVAPAVGLCDCGKEVQLHGFTNTCDCGADYNMSGQRLAPREQWGEETGEHPSDIVNMTRPYDSNY